MSPENVKIGDHLIVIGNKECDFDQPGPLLNGQPWKVVAISPPFFLCVSGGTMTSFDVRRLAFTKANRKYVNQFEQVVSKTTTPTIESNETHKFTCPVCLGPMVEHIIPGGENRLACQQCKFSGGMDQ